MNLLYNYFFTTIFIDTKFYLNYFYPQDFNYKNNTQPQTTIYSSTSASLYDSVTKNEKNQIPNQEKPGSSQIINPGHQHGNSMGSNQLTKQNISNDNFQQGSYSNFNPHSQRNNYENDDNYKTYNKNNNYYNNNNKNNYNYNQNNQQMNNNYNSVNNQTSGQNVPINHNNHHRNNQVNKSNHSNHSNSNKNSNNHSINHSNNNQNNLNNNMNNNFDYYGK